MPKSRKKTSLTEFIQKAEKERRQSMCACCKNKELAEQLEKFLIAKAAGESSLSLHWAHDRWLVPEYDAPHSYSAILRHVRRCLKRDPKTGEKLNAKEK